MVTVSIRPKANEELYIVSSQSYTRTLRLRISSIPAQQPQLRYLLMERAFDIIDS